jgi:hypothetical protein
VSSDVKQAESYLFNKRKTWCWAIRPGGRIQNQSIVWILHWECMFRLFCEIVIPLQTSYTFSNNKLKICHDFRAFSVAYSELYIETMHVVERPFGVSVYKLMNRQHLVYSSGYCWTIRSSLYLRLS